MTPHTTRRLTLVAALLALATTAAPRPGQAQTPGDTVRSLSLSDALRIAESQSEAVRIAQAGAQRARGQQLQARSQYLPQLSGSAQYVRTLASQFEALQTSEPTPPPGTPPVPPPDDQTYYTPCTRYLAPAAGSNDDRLRGLESFARCSSGGGFDFTQAGFGAENQYTLGLQGSLNLFTGGRVQAQNQAAKAGRRAAEIEVSAQRAQLTLDVTQAYFDAALADRLVSIAESSLVQTESALRQTQLARQVGNQSEFELLRAQVTRDNQVPAVLQRRTDRNLAYLRLKQLLNLPSDDSLMLTDGIGDDAPAAGVRTTPTVLTPPAVQVAARDTSAEERATVRQLSESVRIQEAQRRATRAERLPALSLSTQYGRVAFPADGTPTWSNFLTNWTVTIGATMPLFTGGRLRGDALVADANLVEARARLEQTRELASLDAQLVVAQLQQAEAAMAASAGTAQQASRAYGIAEVRYREGISTSLELSESRILLQQALANRAQAARDLQVARVRLALLKDLPLQPGGSQQRPGAAPAGGPLPGASMGQPQPQQPRGQAASTTGTGQ